MSAIVITAAGLGVLHDWKTPWSALPIDIAFWLDLGWHIHIVLPEFSHWQCLHTDILVRTFLRKSGSAFRFDTCPTEPGKASASLHGDAIVRFLFRIAAIPIGDVSWVINTHVPASLNLITLQLKPRRACSVWERRSGRFLHTHPPFLFESRWCDETRDRSLISRGVLTTPQFGPFVWQ